jgi:hypothetical protein
MFLKPENGASPTGRALSPRGTPLGFGVGALVTTDPLENPEAIVKCMGQNMNLRLIPVHHFAIKPDFFCFLHEESTGYRRQESGHK